MRADPGTHRPPACFPFPLDNTCISVVHSCQVSAGCWKGGSWLTPHQTLPWSQHLSLVIGWNGWGCTDNAEAFSYGFQLLSTLLLCLSNVMFVPPVAIAVRSHYLLEAAVYIFTMFFSTVSVAWGS